LFGEIADEFIEARKSAKPKNKPSQGRSGRLLPHRRCEQADPKIDANSLTDFAAICKADQELLEEVVGDPSLIADVRALLARKIGNVPQPVTD